MRRRYLRMNAVMWEAEQQTEQFAGTLKAYRKHNTKFVNIFIHTPLAMALGCVAVVGFLQMGAYSKFTEKILDFPRLAISKPAAAKIVIKRYFHEIAVASRDVRFKPMLYSVGSCYLLCFVGAAMLGMNVSFKQERKIREALITNKYVDFDGHPWLALWTPEVIIFHTYQCDGNAFTHNVRFWNTINFKPDAAIGFSHDSNKIMVGLGYTLPALIDFRLPVENGNA